MGEHFFEKSVAFFFWLDTKSVNLTKDIDGEDSILGFFEERFGESGWSRAIWSNLERWKMKHGHDWKFTLSYLYHWSSFFCYYAALFQSAKAGFNSTTWTWDVLRDLWVASQTARNNAFFSNTFNPQDPKNDDFSQEIRFQKKILTKTR